LEENQLKYTEISVSDTGYGISQEALPHIFNRYYQVNSEHQVAGSGIGLALVKSLAELHEGILSVESTLDVGTTFRLKLLRNNTYPNAVHKENKTTIQQSVHPISEIENSTAEERPIILIVEDNADIREYVNSSLGEVYDIITATNGKEGLDIAQAKIPNVIVSDVMMPIMDGLELCRQLKKDIRTSHIPIVLLTAKNSLQDKEAGYAAGVDSYLTKPFSASLLHSRINNILETRKMIASKFTVLESKLQDKEEAISNNSLTRLDNEFLRQVTEIIENNLETEKLDIAFIAEKMCMSHSTLYRKIKGLTEMSANEYIRKIKMRKSLSLMKDGYSISEIAFMLGFSSTAYFRQCFKDEYGMSPTEYQKRKQ
jgi:DNA-binding response OmpR family regulator